MVVIGLIWMASHISPNNLLTSYSLIFHDVTNHKKTTIRQPFKAAFFCFALIYVFQKLIKCGIIYTKS